MASPSIPVQPPSWYLEQARQRMFQLLTGQLPSEVETPQLGRVAFLPTTASDLQRVIDYLSDLVLNGDVWPANGGSMTGYSRGRKPFSFYAA